MILIAFDVDGTLDSSNGPVVWGKVRVLEEESKGNIIVGIVSLSSLRPKDDTPGYFAPAGMRRENLKLFSDSHPCPAEICLRLYVSDNKDMMESDAAGFTYIEAVEFAKGLR